MSESTPPPRKARGGSDTARKAGLRGITVHFSPEELALISAAARLSHPSLKAFLRDLGMAEARRRIPQKPENPSPSS